MPFKVFCKAYFLCCCNKLLKILWLRAMVGSWHHVSGVTQSVILVSAQLYSLIKLSGGQRSASSFVVHRHCALQFRSPSVESQQCSVLQSVPASSHLCSDSDPQALFSSCHLAIYIIQARLQLETYYLATSADTFFCQYKILCRFQVLWTGCLCGRFEVLLACYPGIVGLYRVCGPCTISSTYQGFEKIRAPLNCTQQEWVLVECTSPRDSQIHCLLGILTLGLGVTEDIRVSLWENGKHYLSGKSMI